jgi:ribose 5-phosphate isomerase A
MEHKKKSAGEKAAEYIEDGMVVGLGTGSTAYYLIKKLGSLVSEGLFIKAVMTSNATEKLAGGMNIPLLSVDEVNGIDLLIDGVDEIDKNFNAIKGGGGALFREKLVARLARRIIWILDDSKLVDNLGKFPLPVEILPFGHTHTIKKMKKEGMNPVLRISDDGIYKTDNGNYIADLHLEPPVDIQKLDARLKSIVGVLETGLFLNKGERMIIGTDGKPREILNKGK